MDAGLDLFLRYGLTIAKVLVFTVVGLSGKHAGRKVDGRGLVVESGKTPGGFVFTLITVPNNSTGTTEKRGQ